MPRFLILTGDAAEALEVFYPKYRLEEEGWTAELAAPEKRTIRTVVHDFEPGFDTYTEKPGYRIDADLAIADVRPEAYDGLVLPGGRAPEYLRNIPEAAAIVRHFLDAGKPVAAICHAVLILAAAARLDDRKLTCYPQCAPDAKAVGAEFIDREVVVDGNLVTARAWNDDAAWMREFVRLARSRLV